MSARRITRRRPTDELVVGLPFLTGNRQGREKPTSSLPPSCWSGWRASRQSERADMKSSRRYEPRRCRQCGEVRDGICFPTSWNRECIVCIQGPEKYCVRCARVKPKSQFTKSGDRWKDGLFPYCRSCLRDARRRGGTLLLARDSLGRKYGLL